MISIKGFDIEDTKERTAVAIEKWYDRHQRLWVLYPVDAEGNQLEQATYCYGKSEANAIQKELEDKYIK